MHIEAKTVKRVTIIGAGIAGLSAGCYLQMNGYDTQIFEAHNLPGGVCTEWKRNGCTSNWKGSFEGWMKSSRDVAQLICKRDKKKFTTSSF